jgi:uncharacterized protein YciI
MFIVHLTYLVPLDQVDEALEAHRRFLDEHFAAGVFVAAGPKVPRDGGVIIATNVDRTQLDAILASDPFALQGVAAYAVTEFKATRIGPGVNLHPQRA